MVTVRLRELIIGENYLRWNLY